MQHGNTYGRSRIETSETSINAQNLLAVLSRSESAFAKNRAEIRYLHNYFLGVQPVLNKQKVTRPEINNTPVENHCQEIVNFFTGYISGKPWVYVRNGGPDKVSEDVHVLNRMMSYEGKATSDRILTQWMCEVGVAYRIVVSDKSYAGMEDEAPFLIDNIDSDMAYVIRNSGVGHRVLAGVLHVNRDNNTELICVYTPDMYYEVENGKIVKQERHLFGAVPITEYELNPERMGAAEPVISLLDSINNIEADRCDGVDQFVQSFMKFVNCEIDEEKFEALKERGAIAIRSTAQAPADVDLICNELNQQQSQVLVDHMLNQVCSITGMPRVGNMEKSDSSNVGATIVRGGWNQTEARAQQVEALIRKSELDFLRVALNILRAQGLVDLTLSDIDIRFPRREYDNIQSKVQAFATLINLPIDPEIAFKQAGMFPDPQSDFEASKKYLAYAKKYWEGDNAPEEEATDTPEQMEETPLI